MKQDRTRRQWALFGHVRTAWRVLWHRRAPWFAKFLLVAAAVYAVSPFDILPDFMLGIGWIDDAAIVTLLISLAFRLVPAAVMAECEGATASASRVKALPSIVK